MKRVKNEVPSASWRYVVTMVGWLAFCWTRPAFSADQVPPGGAMTPPFSVSGDEGSDVRPLRLDLAQAIGAAPAAVARYAPAPARRLQHDQHDDRRLVGQHRYGQCHFFLVAVQPLSVRGAFQQERQPAKQRARRCLPRLPDHPLWPAPTLPATFPQRPVQGGVGSRYLGK